MFWNYNMQKSKTLLISNLVIYGKFIKNQLIPLQFKLHYLIILFIQFAIVKEKSYPITAYIIPIFVSENRLFKTLDIHGQKTKKAISLTMTVWFPIISINIIRSRVILHNEGLLCWPEIGTWTSWCWKTCCLSASLSRLDLYNLYHL